MSTPELEAYDKVESALRDLHAWLGEQLRQADYADEVVKLRHTKAGAWLAVEEIWRLRDEAHHAPEANTRAVECGTANAGRACDPTGVLDIANPEREDSAMPDGHDSNTDPAVTNAPHRVQLKRTKGWRLPPNTVVVSRPSRWGNWYVVATPFDIYPNTRYTTDKTSLLVAQVDKRGRFTGSRWGGFTAKSEATAFAVDLYRRSLIATYLLPDGALDREFYLGELRGKNLACWCPLDQPCHADVLLELANGGT